MAEDIRLLPQTLCGIKAVINSFVADESIAKRRARTALRNDTLEGDLAYMCTHFVFLADIIEKLECLGATLTQNVGLTWDVQAKFDTIPNGPLADKVIKPLAYGPLAG